MIKLVAGIIIIATVAIVYSCMMISSDADDEMMCEIAKKNGTCMKTCQRCPWYGGR